MPNDPVPGNSHIQIDGKNNSRPVDQYIYLYGIPDIPEKYSKGLGRMQIEASWNPYSLLKDGNFITWSAFALFLIFHILVIYITRIVIRKVKS